MRRPLLTSQHHASSTAAAKDARSDKRVDEVVAEVKVLQDLIQRLVAKQGAQNGAGVDKAVANPVPPPPLRLAEPDVREQEIDTGATESLGHEPDIDPPCAKGKEG